MDEEPTPQEFYHPEPETTEEEEEEEVSQDEHEEENSSLVLPIIGLAIVVVSEIVLFACSLKYGPGTFVHPRDL